MCPIVPTFTCGLVRSNFSLAIGSKLRLQRLAAPFQNRAVPKGTRIPFLACPGLAPWANLFRPESSAHRLSLHPGDDLLGHRTRHFLIACEVHGIGRAALGTGAHVGGVA